MEVIPTVCTTRTATRLRTPAAQNALFTASSDRRHHRSGECESGRSLDDTLVAPSDAPTNGESFIADRSVSGAVSKLTMPAPPSQRQSKRLRGRRTELHAGRVSSQL